VEYPREFVEVLLGLSRTSFVDEPFDDLLQRVADRATEQIAGCDMAGVTLVGDGGPVTAVFTDPVAPEIDTAQYRTGRRPCLDAYHNGTILRIDDTAHDLRWPELAALAATNGIRSTLSLPLRAGDESLGALNLYSRVPDNFADTEQIAAVFVAHAAAALANSQAFWAAHVVSEQLREALVSRAVIEQAKGMLMARHRCDSDAAFQLIRRESQDTNTKVREVASGIVATVGAGSTEGPV
jgi:GAF domain-containing protein